MNPVLLAHCVHLAVAALLLVSVAQLHISGGTNAKTQFVVLLLALFGGALCWLWSNAVRQLRERVDAPFGFADPRTPWVVAAFFGVLAILAIARIV